MKSQWSGTDKSKIHILPQTPYGIGTQTSVWERNTSKCLGKEHKQVSGKGTKTTNKCLGKEHKQVSGKGTQTSVWERNTNKCLEKEHKQVSGKGTQTSVWERNTNKCLGKEHKQVSGKGTQTSFWERNTKTHVFFCSSCYSVRIMKAFIVTPSCYSLHYWEFSANFVLSCSHERGEHDV